LLREQRVNEELLRAVSFQRIARAERELAVNNVGHAEELLAECPAQLRGWEWHFLKRWPHEQPRILNAGEVWLMALAYSADGRSLAASTVGNLLQGGVQVWDADTGQLRYTLRGHLGPVIGMAFSPDAARLATAGMDNVVRLWDVATGKPIRVLRTHS